MPEVEGNEINHHPLLLFIHDVQRATLNKHRLVLEQAAPQLLATLYDSGLITAQVTLERYLGLWEKGGTNFKALPAQAILSYSQGNQMKTIRLDLIGLEKNDDQLIYHIKPLKEDRHEQVEQAALSVEVFPTVVNGQITDSITQANVNVLGDAPVIAMGNLYQATAQALGNAAHNATAAQQQTGIVAQQAMEQGIAILYAIDTASTGKATEKIMEA